MINSRAGVHRAAEPRITVRRYVHRNEMVHPTTADVPEQAYGHGASESGA